MTAPLIVSLAVDANAQERFDALRRAHFPPERNHLAAHVTLFHALPGEEEAQVLADLRAVAARAPYDVRVAGVRSLGRGVALGLRSTDLDADRARLARRWERWLTPQDRSRFSAHVTVQNKVSPERARALLTELETGFVPYDVRAVGLQVWRYLGGPWKHVGTVPYDPADTEACAMSVNGPFA